MEGRENSVEEGWEEVLWLSREKGDTRERERVSGRRSPVRSRNKYSTRARRKGSSFVEKKRA